MNLSTIDPAILTLPPSDSTREGCYRPGDPRLPSGKLPPDGLRKAHDLRSGLAGAILRRAARIGIMFGAPLSTFARAILTAPDGKPWVYLPLARYAAQDLCTAATLARDARFVGLSRVSLVARSLTRRPLTDALSTEEHWRIATSDCVELAALMASLDTFTTAEGEARLVVDLLPGFRVCTVEHASRGLVELRAADGGGHKLIGRPHLAL